MCIWPTHTRSHWPLLTKTTEGRGAGGDNKYSKDPKNVKMEQQIREGKKKDRMKNRQRNTTDVERRSAGNTFGVNKCK